VKNPAGGGLYQKVTKRSNIFDPIQTELDQSVFKGIDPKSSVIRTIEKLYGRAFEKELGQADPFEYLDLYLTGSLTTYQYSETSDCDISVIPHYDELESVFGLDADAMRKQLISLSIEHIDGTFLPGTTHPLQFFVVPAGTMPEDLYQPGLRSAWSFRDKQWFVPPEKDRVHDISTELPELYARAEQMADKMTQMLDHDPDKARELWKQIHKKRQLDQRAGLGDFCEGNIVYKYLLHLGLFDRIRNELHEYIAKIAGTTRNQRIQIMEFADARGPDQSDVIHEFPDGWSVRRIKTDGDAWREGYLMHNCWARRGERGCPDERTLGFYGHMYSLRDPDNWPLVSFYVDPANDFDRLPDSSRPAIPAGTMRIHYARGHGNSTPKPEHMERIQEWARITGLPTDWDNNESYLDRYTDPTLRQGGVARKTTMALRPSDLRSWIAEHGPYAYHETGLDNIDSILQQGIQSGDDYQDMGLGGTQREGVAYMWLPNSKRNLVGQFPIRIDLRKLDPSKFVNDEDAAEDLGFDPEDATSREDLGDWVQGQPEFDQPHNVLRGMKGGTVAYLGYVPPQAVEANPDWFADPKNQAAYEKANKEHKDWLQRHKEIADEFDALQERMKNPAGFLNVDGNSYAWEEDGLTYMLSSEINGRGEKIPPVWFGIRNPPDEVVKAMNDQGIQTPWQKRWTELQGQPRESAAKTLVIYDFHGDKIILGTYSQAQNTAGGRIIGTYDGDDVVLYRNQEWLNPSYFRRLWHESFPTKPLRKVRVR
jgi:hypothetical protein